MKFSGSKRTVIDGPFTETRELIAGFWLWQVKSRDEAIEWVKQIPNPMPGTETEVKLRPPTYRRIYCPRQRMPVISIR